MWVGDPEDWAQVRAVPRPPLVCPEPDCDVELISYENLHNRHNPKIFKFKSVDRSCDHWSDRGQGGGVESAQHDWMKLRLTRIATRLGYTATPEHAPTNADVFVHEALLCLEVQLRPTQFSTRTAARNAKGANVCWLIREGLDTTQALKALYRLPAVRFRVIDKANPQGRLLTPWDHPTDRDLAYRARLQVFGTVAHRPRAGQKANPMKPGGGWFRTGSMDGFQFLKEVFGGQRRWYRPYSLGHDAGLWALEGDVAEYYAFREKRRSAGTATSPLPQGTSSSSPPEPTADSAAPAAATESLIEPDSVCEVPVVMPVKTMRIEPALIPEKVRPARKQPPPQIIAFSLSRTRLRGTWWRRLWRRI